MHDDCHLNVTPRHGSSWTPRRYGEGNNAEDVPPCSLLHACLPYYVMGHSRSSGRWVENRHRQLYCAVCRDATGDVSCFLLLLVNYAVELVATSRSCGN